jgi:hypothetical protein
MSVYRRVCLAPAGSPPSYSAESQDVVQAHRWRNSEYYQKSRSPRVIKLNACATNKSPSISEKAERSFVKEKARYVFLLRATVALNVLISVVQNALCCVYSSVLLRDFYVFIM